MNNIEEAKGLIIKYMESMGLVNDKNGVSKANIVLSVGGGSIDESQEYLIGKAFDNLVLEDRIRSSCNKYDKNGKLIRGTGSMHEEKFYLNK
ncbi:hypothetical protein phiCTC2B_58 (endogenous virus) [Clostridium phage phiCTC2B]|nr:hypothetical protein [Clostridium tetani]YP_009276955.1 hypothetical protein phiCT19406B_58 [Clostridium phage phiCT19406B]YP_009277399.1 hypothetical protein phiCTC2B_58 [Clostridium phage phiCTC2B]AJA42815.1 hypothetical protein phiCT19406B_58 [Clostridium phage phiCT19406B]AJA43011.1 hypothetical protein phiCTC2B_58 [Clostridium phage phiCTC2B]KGI39093.1 hypothetical protein KY52_04680 [Clostridium tetani]KGI43662.1 hypothetical protein KY54_09970 [Clostridium tetani]KHO31345.1 hypothe